MLGDILVDIQRGIHSDSINFKIYRPSLPKSVCVCTVFLTKFHPGCVLFLIKTFSKTSQIDHIKRSHIFFILRSYLTQFQSQIKQGPSKSNQNCSYLIFQCRSEIVKRKRYHHCPWNKNDLLRGIDYVLASKVRAYIQTDKDLVNSILNNQQHQARGGRAYLELGGVCCTSHIDESVSFAIYLG